MTGARPARNSLAWRLGFLYAALFLVVGCYLPYMPVWLSYRELGADQIALLLAAPLFTRVLFTPIITFGADRAPDRRTILIALAWGSLVSFLLLFLASGFVQMLLASILLAINWTTIMPMIETVAVAGIRRGAIDYGKVRLWGSISFIVASLGAGLLIQHQGAEVVLPLLLAAAALTLLGVHLLPRELTARTRATPSPHRRIRLGDAIALARTPLFVLFLIAASMVQASHALYYSFGTLHWHAQGLSGGVIGALWSWGVVAEVVLFANSGRIIAVSGTARLLMLAGGAATVRWGFMATDPPLFATALLQTLHALSFGAAHLAAIHFMAHAVPEDRAASAQGIYAAGGRRSLGAATLSCGPLYRSLGGEAYGVMALLALIGMGCAVLLMRHWNGGLIIGAGEPEHQA